jgi:hypothetical protein
MNVEQPPADVELDPNAPPAEEHDDDGLIETVKVGEQRMVPVSELIRVRKESKTFRKELETLRPQIERANAVSAQLEQLQPVLETIQRMTPQQREALATGKLPSPAGTPQPSDDVEARELAEDLGLIAQDGSLDIARARKRLDKDNTRFQRMLQEAVAPVRQSAAHQQAAALKAQAFDIKDATGMPMATRESINEAYSMLPPELAAQPNVAMVAIGTAMLIDRMRGRTVKAPEPDYGAPLYSEPVAGRRGQGLSAEDKAIAGKVGLSEKDLTDTIGKLQNSGGRGVRLE